MGWCWSIWQTRECDSVTDMGTAMWTWTLHWAAPSDLQLHAGANVRGEPCSDLRFGPSCAQLQQMAVSRHCDPLWQLLTMLHAMVPVLAVAVPSHLHAVGSSCPWPSSQRPLHTNSTSDGNFACGRGHCSC